MHIYANYLLSEKSPYLELFWSEFPAFRLNTERYSVSLRIQSKCGKIQTRINPNMDTFYAVIDLVVKLFSVGHSHLGAIIELWNHISALNIRRLFFCFLVFFSIVIPKNCNIKVDRLQQDIYFFLMQHWQCDGTLTIQRSVAGAKQRWWCNSTLMINAALMINPRINCQGYITASMLRYKNSVSLIM